LPQILGTWLGFCDLQFVFRNPFLFFLSFLGFSEIRQLELLACLFNFDSFAFSFVLAFADGFFGFGFVGEFEFFVWHFERVGGGGEYGRLVLLCGGVLEEAGMEFEMMMCLTKMLLREERCLMVNKNWMCEEKRSGLIEEELEQRMACVTLKSCFQGVQRITASAYALSPVVTHDF
jgi:hypothetical protein